MRRFIPAILVCLTLLSACSKNWDIADSGLDGETPANYQPEDITVSDVEELAQLDIDQSNAGSGAFTSTSSQYDPNVTPPKILDSIMGSAWREFTNAPIQNTPSDRSLDAYLAVLLQFNVVESYKCRYTPSCGGTSDTRCNIYASDVMNAMGSPLPTKGDLGKGHGDAKYTDPMPANAEDIHAWLETQQDGWRKLDPANSSDWALLIEHVSSGKPALASHPDHIAVLRPDQLGDLGTGNVGGLHIAQAGAYNSNNTLIQSAFGNRDVDIYIHD